MEIKSRKHIFSFLLTTLLLAFMAAMFLSCAPKSSSEVLSESISEMLDGYKSQDRSAFEEFSEYMDIGELEQFGIDPVDFTKTFFDGFDYSIDSISVGEHNACVTVTLHAIDYCAFENLLEQEIYAMEENGISKSLSNERFKNTYGQLVMECLEGTDLINIADVKFDYTMDGNTWKADKTPFAVLAKALMQE